MGCPSSFHDSTDAPRQRACSSPARTGRVGTPPTNAVHVSVPPDMENSHVSEPTSSYTHRNPSGDSGEPVEPTARSALRSRPERGDTPAFMHEEMNAALVPKQVTLVAAARCHSDPRSGYPGFPSYSTIEASVSSTPTSRFHIIQPVVENQNTRSPTR